MRAATRKHEGHYSAGCMLIHYVQNYTRMLIVNITKDIKFHCLVY